MTGFTPELVERVARAIKASRGSRWSGPIPNWDPERREAEWALEASGIAELTEALTDATDLLEEWVGNECPGSISDFRAMLAKIGGKQQPSDEPSQDCIQNRDRPRTFQQDPRIHALDGECVCGAKSCPQCGPNQKRKT
jgi:hypothetical protein